MNSSASGLNQTAMNTRAGHINKATIEMTQWGRITQLSVTKPADNIITGAMENRTGLGTHCTGSAMISVCNMPQSNRFVTLNGNIYSEQNALF